MLKRSYVRYYLWVDIVWDFIIALSFFGVAAGLVSAVRTGKVGIVLGRSTFYLIALSLACAGVFRVASGIGLWRGDWVTFVAAAKTLTGLITLATCFLVNLHVRWVRELPRSADRAFARFSKSVDELRHLHGGGSA